MDNQANPNQLITYTFALLSSIDGLTHGVFTRHGGVSRPPYDTLNCAWNSEDAPEAVQENLVRVKHLMGVERLVSSRQVHGDTIHVIDEEAMNHASIRSPVLITAPGDALVTALTGIGLLIKIADCQAIFLVDPPRRVIANIHCGWRGSVHELPQKTIRVMQERFGCRPEDLLATISPSLGPCCAEFKNYRDELPSSFREHQHRPLYFDFWAISRRQLMEAGVRPERIETAGRCTVCETQNFFSYRAEKVTGRLAAVIGWKNVLRG